MTAKWSLNSLDGIRTQLFLQTVVNQVVVRYALYRKDKVRRCEMLRADVVCVRHRQNNDHETWNFGKFEFQFEVSSSVEDRDRSVLDKHFATPNRDIIHDGVFDVFKGWEEEIAEKSHAKHVPAQPEWLELNQPFVGVLMIGDERSLHPASSSHWLLYHGLVMAKIMEYRHHVLTSEDETRMWLNDILWTLHHRFGAFVAQSRNEIAQRMFAG